MADVHFCAGNVRKNNARNSTMNSHANRSIRKPLSNESSELLSKKDQSSSTEDLCLRSQHLVHLPNDFGASFIHLETLDLSDNLLESVPGSIGLLSRLKRLRLSDNRLCYLPLGVTKLRSLVSLDLANNFLTRLPSNLAELRNLEVLLIGNNCLTRLPFSCNRMNALRELDLSGNRIRRLGSFTNLAKLNLARNMLVRLPGEICRLEKLQVLDVRSNSLVELPEGIGGMIGLRELRANSNRLDGLPDSASKLGDLAYLDLRDNDFRELPGALSRMDKLVGLDVDRNRVDARNFLIGGIEYEELRRSLRNRYRSEECERETGRKHDEPEIARRERSTKFISENTHKRHEKTREKGEDAIEENWDVSEDSADEWDPTCENGNSTRRPSTKYSYLEVISRRRLYCPADFHPLPIKQQIAELVKRGILQIRTDSDVGEGHFDDA